MPFVFSILNAIRSRPRRVTADCLLKRALKRGRGRGKRWLYSSLVTPPEAVGRRMIYRCPNSLRWNYSFLSRSTRFLGSIFFESRIISLYRGCDIAHISVSRVIKRAGSFEWTGRRAGIGYRDVNGRQVGRDASSTRAHRRTHVHIRMQSAMLRRTPLSPVN